VQHVSAARSIGAAAGDPGRDGRAGGRTDPARDRRQDRTAARRETRSGMKIIERKRYGSRGEGSLVRYDGVENWYSVYCAHGKEIRQTTGTADFKAAKKFHKGVLDAL